MKEFVIANNMATGPAPTTNGMTAQQIADWEAAYGSPIGGSQAPTADQTTGITHNEVFLKLPTSDKQAWLDMVVKLGKDTFTDSSGKTWRKLPDGTWTDSAIGLDQPQSSDYQYDPAFIPSWGS